MYPTRGAFSSDWADAVPSGTARSRKATTEANRRSATLRTVPPRGCKSPQLITILQNRHSPRISTPWAQRLVSRQSRGHGKDEPCCPSPQHECAEQADDRSGFPAQPRQRLAWGANDDGRTDDEERLEYKRVTRFGDGDEAEQQAAEHRRGAHPAGRWRPAAQPRDTRQPKEEHDGPLKVRRRKQPERDWKKNADAPLPADELQHVRLRREDPREPPDGTAQELDGMGGNPQRRFALQLLRRACRIRQLSAEILAPVLDLLGGRARPEQVEVFRVEILIPEVEVVGAIGGDGRNSGDVPGAEHARDDHGSRHHHEHDRAADRRSIS